MKRIRKKQSKAPPLERAKRSFHNSKIFIFVMFLVLLFTVLVGYTFPGIFYEQALALLEQIILEVGDREGLSLITYIFLNNVQASFLAMILGAGLGIFPLLAAFMNGYLIGFVAQFAVAQEGFFVLWRLIPHGIFELPAIIFSMGVGLYLGNKMIAHLFSVKQQLHRLLIAFAITIILVPILILYVSLSTSLVSQSEAISSGVITSTSIILLLFLLLFNIGFIVLGAYVISVFYRVPHLREEFIDALWLFVLYIIPLLLVAGIIEGLLITIMG